MMKLKRERRMNKALTGAIISLLLLVPQTTIVLANEGDTPIYSSWALGELLEGEKYGVFPISWYEQDMRREISMAELTQFTIGLSKKIEELPGVTQKSEIEAKVFQGKITRQDVVETIYNVISSYNYPKDIGIDAYTAREYMREKDIIQGDESGLALT